MDDLLTHWANCIAVTTELRRYLFVQIKNTPGEGCFLTICGVDDAGVRAVSLDTSGVSILGRLQASAPRSRAPQVDVSFVP
jgi:hypothetical protein